MAVRRMPDKQLRAMQDLTAHLRKCYECKASIKTGHESPLCRDGMMMAVTAAKGFSNLSRMHSAAFRSEGKTVYACPDPKKHGLSYQMTATPLMVTAFADTLF